MTSTEDDFSLFLKNPIFKGLADEQIRKIFDLSKELTVEKGTVLLEEGDLGKEVFFILEGHLEVMKFDKKSKEHYLIANLGKGEVIGEVSFLDQGYRSAAIRALSFVRLRSIEFSALQALVDTDKSYYQIFFEFAKNISRRLRESNEKQIIEYKTRVYMCNLLVYLILGFSLFMFAMPWMKVWIVEGKVSTYITGPATLLFLFFLYLFIKKSFLPLSTFGITLVNLRRSIKEVIITALPFFLVIAFVKWFLINYSSLYRGNSLFEWNYVSYYKSTVSGSTWLSTLALYWFFISPVQELIVRGCLQGSLETFLIGKWKKFVAILSSNLLFTTFHLFISFWFAVLVLFPGFYFGWLYSRTHNLFGVWLAHGLVGTWGLWIVGF